MAKTLATDTSEVELNVLPVLVVLYHHIGSNFKLRWYTWNTVTLKPYFSGSIPFKFKITADAKQSEAPPYGPPIVVKLHPLGNKELGP
jgi:hypothetical protein